MSNSNLSLESIKTLELLSVLSVADELEAKSLELGLEEYKRQGGLDDAKGLASERLYDFILSRNHGNQQFCKDSIHILWFRTLNGEAFDSDDERFLHEICKDHLVNETVYLRT